MNPLTFEQLVALGSLLLAAVTVALTLRRDSSNADERREARAAEQQVVSDKLDSISEMSRETRDTVREMSKQLTDHGQQLAKVETRIEEHERRISALENRTDFKVGGNGSE